MKLIFHSIFLFEYSKCDLIEEIGLRNEKLEVGCGISRARNHDYEIHG